MTKQKEKKGGGISADLKEAIEEIVRFHCRYCGKLKGQEDYNANSMCEYDVEEQIDQLLNLFNQKLKEERIQAYYTGYKKKEDEFQEMADKLKEKLNRNKPIKERTLTFIPSEGMIKSFISFRVTEVLKEINKKVKKIKKKKHDDIEGVKDEEYKSGHLEDCSYTEAQCFNSALSEVIELLKRYGR